MKKAKQKAWGNKGLPKNADEGMQFFSKKDSLKQSEMKPKFAGGGMVMRGYGAATKGKKTRVF